MPSATSIARPTPLIPGPGKLRLVFDGDNGE
jgi:hypothetical protein